jgi:hypothetical protein
MEPEVGLYITDSLFRIKYRKIAAQYERYFTTQCPLDYKFISDTSGFEGLMVNTLNDFQIPEPNASIIPYFEISPGYAVTYTMTRDHSQILAFIYNVTNHKKHRVEYSYIHRLPQPADLFFSTKNLTGNYSFQIFDLDDKKLIQEGTTEGNIKYKAAKTKHDYYIIINQK